MVKLVVLDMAGTTVKDDHEVEKCFKEACVLTGLELSDEEILAAQGWSKRFVFEHFWKKKIGDNQGELTLAVDKSYNVFKEVLEGYYSQKNVLPTEGAIETFNFLKEHDIKCVLTTGFYRKITDIILEKLGWLEGLDENYVGGKDSLISMSISSDDVENGRPNPDMIHKAMRQFGIDNAKEVIKIGDTPSDIQAGKAANCLMSIGLTNGTHSQEQLEKTDYDLLLTSLLKFPEVLKEELVVNR